MSSRSPILNVPTSVSAFLLILIAIHAFRSLVASGQQNLEILLWNAFIPGRFSNPELFGEQGISAYWTAISYSLIHADWLHLGMNSFWMLAFGSVVAWRLGSLRFALFAAFASISGALLHFLLHMDDLTPMIGASAVVSGCMGAACRFAFPSNGNFRIDGYQHPIQTVSETSANRQAMMFIVIWFLINYLFGSGIVDVTGTGGGIAWEAHVGGFVFGFFALPTLVRKI